MGSKKKKRKTIMDREEGRVAERKSRPGRLQGQQHSYPPLWIVGSGKSFEHCRPPPGS